MKTEIKKVSHVFSEPEIADLNQQFRRAYNQVKVIGEEFDSVKANYKARIAESEARATTLDSLITAGFELRDKTCVVVFAYKDKKKHYFLETDCDKEGVPNKDAKPVVTDEMTEGDFQVDMLESESKFEAREEIVLFPATENNCGVLVVGQHGGKWHGALCAVIGGRKLSERLDSEQPSCKKRPDAVSKAIKRFAAWITETLGKEVAKGFEEGSQGLWCVPMLLKSRAMQGRRRTDGNTPFDMLGYAV